jgi:hypothetical protein
MCENKSAHVHECVGACVSACMHPDLKFACLLHAPPPVADAVVPRSCRDREGTVVEFR